MIYAYLIEDVRALSDLFKIGVSPKKSAHGQFTVFKVRHPEFNTRRALIVSGVSKTGLKEPLPATVGSEIKIDFKDGTLFWYDPRGHKKPVEVFEYRVATCLSALIDPVPWRKEAEHGGSVIFWLHDPSLMADIVRRSLYLNNDRIQIASIHDGKKDAMLVRIEAPSYYLIAWCEEQEHGKLDLFHTMTESPGLYVQWRHEHPLADLWRRAWTKEQEQWVFFPAKGKRRHVPAPKWASIYALAQFTLPLEDKESWRQINNLVDHFEIPLKLMPRHEPLDVEMLLLSKKDRPKLEDFLSLSDEEDVDKLEISAQKGADEEQWFFVREKHRSGGTMLVELGGQGFARYKGFDNLFLPVHLVLEPQLRRDQYRKLFGLESGALTFVVPGLDHETKDANLKMARHIKVLKNSFEPLRHFVDHVVHFERSSLMRVLEQSVFDLDVYKEAPSRLDLTQGLKNKDKEANTKRVPKSRLESTLSLERQGKQDVPPRTARAMPTSESADEQELSVMPSELELLETQLERDLIRQGPFVHIWRDLSAVKLQLKKWLEATVASVEGLWSLSFPDPGSEAVPAQDVAGLSDTFKRSFIDAQKNFGQEPKALAVVATLFDKTLSGGAEEISTLVEAAGQLRNVETKLGKKLCWLSWREILVRTQDVRTQEEVRESLLKELNAKGLDTVDAPTFLRERILKDPNLEFDDDLEGNTDNNYVLQNVETIEQALDKLQTKKIREASRASLARIMAGLGLHARARETLAKSIKAMELDLDEASMGGRSTAQAWHVRMMDFFKVRSGTYKDEDIVRPERWHVWVALNAWLVDKSIDPSHALESKKAYELMFDQLLPYEQNDVRLSAESLKARVGKTNIAEFLAQSARSFFSTRALPAEMDKIVQGLQQGYAKGEEETVHNLVLSGVELARKDILESSSPSLEIVARLIIEMAEVLRKLKWNKEQGPVEEFERFIREIPKEPRSTDMSQLYFAVLHCSAVRALMDLGHDKDAMRMLADIMRWLGKEYMQVIDFVDLIKKEVLLTIELAPRSQRNEALRWLMSTLVEQERLEIGDDPEHPGAGFMMPFQAYEIIQMIDHTLEAAISNEKLVLRRLRDFEEREEHRLRYWLQRDQPASS